MTYPTTRPLHKQNSHVAAVRHLRRAGLTLFALALVAVMGAAASGKPSSFLGDVGGLLGSTSGVPSVSAPTVGTLVGPVYPPPISPGVTFSSAAANPGLGIGNTWWFTGTNVASQDTTYWGPQPKKIFLKFRWR